MNFSYSEWVLENCTFCTNDSNCIRPAKFKYPILCLSKKIGIKNFNNFIEHPPEQEISLFSIYLLLSVIIGLQVLHKQKIYFLYFYSWFILSIWVLVSWKIIVLESLVVNKLTESELIMEVT